VLGDFRAWLTDLSVSPAAAAPDPPETVDLFTLIGQFTALRHEVNLQTKAARAAVEQNAEVLKRLTAAPEEPPADAPDDDQLRPVVKALVDIADALALSLRQMEKLRAAAALLADPDDPPPAPARPGFFARLFAPRPAPVAESAATDRLRQFAAAAADGYALSLRRVGRVLPTLDVEPLACAGAVFDPETMEAVEVVAAAGRAPGLVVEEVRPGYLWRGELLRPAQVKVTR